MLQMVRQTFLIVVTMIVCSCSQLEVNGLFVSSSEGVQSRFKQNVEMNPGLKAGVLSAQESYMFYVAADPHVNKTHKNLDIFNDAFRNDSEASFGVILGDCTDVRDNLPTYLEALAYYPERHRYDHRLFHVLGNHDIYFKGWNAFKQMIGPSTYWFEVEFSGGKDLYINLDTASGTLGIRQNRWFREFIKENRSNYRHCVILTHTNFFYTDNSQTSSGNMPIEETMSLIDFLGDHDVSLVLQGHDHYREDLTYKNVRYTVLGAIADKSEKHEYLKVKVSSDSIDFDWQLISE